MKVLSTLSVHNGIQLALGINEMGEEFYLRMLAKEFPTQKEMEMFQHKIDLVEEMTRISPGKEKVRSLLECRRIQVDQKKCLAFQKPQGADLLLCVAGGGTAQHR